MPDEPTFAEKMQRTGKAMEETGCAITKAGCSLLALILIGFFLWTLWS